MEFYDELTRYVEDQSIAAADDVSARGRAVGFTMAMLQRRMASSVYAVRRTLERMRDRTRFEDHAQRFLQHTRLESIHWINVTRGYVTFRTLNKERTGR